VLPARPAAAPGSDGSLEIIAGLVGAARIVAPAREQITHRIAKGCWI